MFLDGDSYQDVSDALRRRPGVAKRIRVAVHIVFIYQLSVAGNQHATNFLELV